MLNWNFTNQYAQYVKLESHIKVTEKVKERKLQKEFWSEQQSLRNNKKTLVKTDLNKFMSFFNRYLF